MFSFLSSKNAHILLYCSTIPAILSLFGICIFVAKVTIIFYRLWYTNHEDIEFFFASSGISKPV